MFNQKEKLRRRGSFKFDDTASNDFRSTDISSAKRKICLSLYEKLWKYKTPLIRRCVPPSSRRWVFWAQERGCCPVFDAIFCFSERFTFAYTKKHDIMDAKCIARV